MRVKLNTVDKFQGMERNIVIVSTVRSDKYKTAQGIVEGAARVSDELKEEIGEELNLTRERVRQIKERALKRLKQETKNRNLKIYL